MKARRGITLGLELSSRQGSAALLRDGELLAEQTWIGESIRHGALFQALESLLNKTGVSYGDISLYAVGRGPGSFSGMRMALAAAQALAMPDKTDVCAVSSGAALAAAAAGEGAEKICVAGDARRGQYWCGFFETAENGAVRLCNDWKLVPYEQLVIPAGTLLVSPDADRLAGRFPDIGAPRFPLAGDVAKLALLQEDPEPLEPLYMHPPVFVAPKPVEP